jgi:hypothetical protein
VTSTLGISRPRSVDLVPPTLQTIPEAIGKNIAIARARTRSRIMAVVKADGYGHGAITVALSTEVVMTRTIEAYQANRIGLYGHGSQPYLGVRYQQARLHDVPGPHFRLYSGGGILMVSSLRPTTYRDETCDEICFALQRCRAALR